MEPTGPALRPRPVITADTEFYWAGAREHRLLIQRCGACSALRHPPTPMCPQCGSLDWDTVTASGHGSLLSYTVVHAPVVAPFLVPYVVGVVELAEGTRVVAELVGVDPGDVSIGMALTLEFLEPDPELTLPVFRPAAGAP
jgi:3-oxo-4,17-pregnadiene-20-carboxyl-CoA hydratase alpha subunit